VFVPSLSWENVGFRKQHGAPKGNMFTHRDYVDDGDRRRDDQHIIARLHRGDELITGQIRGHRLRLLRLKPLIPPALVDKERYLLRPTLV
jgi:hypothetical protein